MYEGKIIASDRENPVFDATRAADELHALNWRGLSARLAAAQDFRRLINRGHQIGGGSFNHLSALHLASIGNGKPDVNPFALVNGKMDADMDVAVSSDAENGDRGR